MNKLSKTETEKSAPAPGGKGAGRGAENPTITKLFFEVVRSEDVQHLNVINSLQNGAGEIGPLQRNGYFERFPHCSPNPDRGANPHQGAAYKQAGGGLEFLPGQPSAKYSWIYKKYS